MSRHPRVVDSHSQGHSTTTTTTTTTKPLSSSLYHQDVPTITNQQTLHPFHNTTTTTHDEKYSSYSLSSKESINTNSSNNSGRENSLTNAILHTSPPWEEASSFYYFQNEFSPFVQPSNDHHPHGNLLTLSTSDANLSEISQQPRNDPIVVSSPSSSHRSHTQHVQTFPSLQTTFDNYPRHQETTIDASPKTQTPSSLKNSESFNRLNAKQEREVRCSESSDRRKYSTTAARKQLSRCASFFAKFITVTNVLIVLFIFQVFLGIASSFVLLYSSGEHVLSHIQDFQRFQMQVFIDREIHQFVDNINTFISHMMRLVYRINLNDEISLLKVIDTVDSLYAKNVGANAYRYARFDDRYLAREYNQTVKGLALRVYDPLETSFCYFKISKEEMIHAPSNNSYTLSEYLHSTFTPFFKSKGVKYFPKSRVYYAPFNKGNNSATDILWTESWINYVGASVVSLSIPLFSNYSLSYLNDTSNRYLIQSELSPKLISIPSVDPNTNPQYKTPEYLFGVLSIQFSIELTISKLLNSTRSGWDILSSYSSNILDNSFIMDAKNAILGQQGGSTRVNAMYNIIVQKQLIEVLIAAKCSAIQLPASMTDVTVTTSNTVFFIIPAGTTVNGTTFSDTLEVEIMPFCDSYNLQWFIVVGVKQTSFFEEAVRGSESYLALFVGLLGLEMILLSLIIVRISCSLNRLAASVQQISQFGPFPSKTNNHPSKWKQTLLNAIDFLQESTLFYDIRLMHQNLSIMNSGLEIFCKYIPDTMKRECAQLDLGFSKRELGVLRVEIQDFYELNIVDTNRIAGIMTKYYNLTSNAIHVNGGVVDKFVGGSVTAVFNLSEEHTPEATATQMCQSALQIVLELEKYNQTFSTNFSVTIVMNYGTMSVGNIGSNNRLSFCVFGPEVTLLKSILDEHHISAKSIIIMTEKVFEKVKNIFTCYFVDFIGINEHLEGVYLLECLSQLSTTKQLENFSSLANVRECIIDRSFKEANAELSKLLLESHLACPYSLLQQLKNKISNYE
ncbi:hypothetical protein FDP41_010479 [Naegleria fowleri]|uniref:Guanylate cyclase domain-containing protein n=1 Tax=Naegleria fowleri TaxID=5763 RepID=A0A6A5CA54_NAEFO|nr:uncharacterized protein FDP41_010479 [Naegleria fowleri]KAF0983414.1 hypothetical protein FDP41_010479 [Naegleria fowleri]